MIGHLEFETNRLNSTSLVLLCVIFRAVARRQDCASAGALFKARQCRAYNDIEVSMSVNYLKLEFVEQIQHYFYLHS